MSNRPWMPLNVADYLKDTRHLTALEHGAYLLLIMRYWEDGGLPDNEALISRYAGLTREQWEECREVLAAFFIEGWRHKRIDAELARAAEVMEKRKASGRQGGTKRVANAKQMLGESQHTDTDIEPSSSLRSGDRRTPRGELETVLDADRSKAVVDHRQRIRRPLTAHAAKLLADKFARCPDPNAAADAMIANGWQGFEPEWLDRPPARGSPPRKSMRGSQFFYAAAEALGDGSVTISGGDESDRDDAPGLPQRAIGHHG